MARDAFDRFLAASDIDEVTGAFAEVCAAVSATHEQGLCLFSALEGRLAPALTFRHQQLFDLLSAQRLRREQTCEAAPGTPARMLVCGAGPCGLRAAVEAALCGFDVVVVEKRATFSRANILTMWRATLDDLIALGAKTYFPDLQRHGLLHMGTRQIQLMLLKTALLLGVRVRYSTLVAGLTWLPDPPATTPEASQAAEAAEDAAGAAEDAAEAQDSKSGRWAARVMLHAGKEMAQGALDFKKHKGSKYIKTYKCNAMEYTQVDESILQQGGGGENGDPEAAGEETLPFDSLIVAEGEWSSTTAALGFDKTVDKFALALGLVINISYDKGNPAEKQLESTTNIIAPASHAQLKTVARPDALPASTRYVRPEDDESLFRRIERAGVRVETIEYLKGETHFVAANVSKASLLAYGALREDRPTSVELLQADNLDTPRLLALARDLATAIGVPDTAPFFPVNPVQLFDYSSRARCIVPGKVLAVRGDSVAALGAEGALAMPVGDALLEPFWPQGLGVNRGFHTAMNAVHAAHVARTEGAEAAALDLEFSYYATLFGVWTEYAGYVGPAESWTADYASRISPRTLVAAAKGWVASGRDLPPRLEDLCSAWQRDSPASADRVGD